MGAVVQEQARVHSEMLPIQWIARELIGKFSRRLIGYLTD